MFYLFMVEHGKFLWCILLCFEKGRQSLLQKERKKEKKRRKREKKKKRMKAKLL